MRRPLLLCVVVTLVAATLPVCADLYVANGNGPSVTVYSPSAVGAAAPSRTISGGLTAFVLPSCVTVDTVNSELYVSDFQGSAIRVFALSDNGNVAPLRTLIDGPNSGLGQPRKVIVDTANNEIAVPNAQDTIRVYSRTTNGDVAPLRVISGAATLLHNPLSLAFDAANGEYITVTANAGGNNSGILVFPRTTNGNFAPSRVISGAATLLGQNNGPFVAYDAVNFEYVARLNVSPSTASALVVFPRTTNGNVAPARVIQGPMTGLFGLGGVVFDPVTSRHFTSSYTAADLVSAFSRTDTGNVAPVLTLFGAATGLNQPFGLDVDATGGPNGAGGSAVPTLRPVGLLGLCILLAAAGFLVLRRVAA